MIAFLVAVVAYLVPDQDVRRPMWLFIFAMLVAIAVHCWKHPAAPTSPKGWLAYVGVAFLGGTYMAIVDIIFLVKVPSGTSIGEAVIHNGWVLLDIAAIICGAIVAVGGWAFTLARRTHEG